MTKIKDNVAVKQYNLCYVKKDREGNYIGSVTVGVAWLTPASETNKERINIIMDSIPINFDGRLILWPKGGKR